MGWFGLPAQNFLYGHRVVAHRAHVLVSLGLGVYVWFLFKSGGVLSLRDGGIAAGERDQFREGALSASCLALARIIPGGVGRA